MASPTTSAPPLAASPTASPRVFFCTRAAPALTAAPAVLKNLYGWLRSRLSVWFSAPPSPCSSSVSLFPSCAVSCGLLAAALFTCLCTVAALLPGCRAQTDGQLTAMATGTGYPPAAAAHCRTYLCAVLVTPVADDWKKQQQFLKIVARGDGPKDAASFKAFMLRMLTLSGSIRTDKPLRISGLISYLEKQPGRFFTRVLPLLASTTLHINDLFPRGLRFLTAVTNPELHLRKTQVFALLAAAFLGVLPHNQKALLLAAAPSLMKAAASAAASSSGADEEASRRSPSSSPSTGSSSLLGGSSAGLSLPAVLAALHQKSLDSLTAAAAPATAAATVAAGSAPAANSASPAAAASAPVAGTASLRFSHRPAHSAAEAAPDGFPAGAAAARPASGDHSVSPPAVFSSSSFSRGSEKFTLRLNKLDMHYRGFFERVPKFEALLLYFDAMERRLSKCWKEILEKKHFASSPPCSTACPCVSPAAANAAAAGSAGKATEGGDGVSKTAGLSSAAAEAAAGHSAATRDAATATAAPAATPEVGVAAGAAAEGDGDDNNTEGSAEEGKGKNIEKEEEEEEEAEEAEEGIYRGSGSTPPNAFSVVDSVIGFYRHSRAKASFSQLSRLLGSYQTVQIDPAIVASSPQSLASLRVLPSGDISMSDGALMVDFADKYVGGLSMFRGHIAQEEFLFIVFPELHVLMLFNDVLGDDEALVVKGVERFVFVSGYEDAFRIEQAAMPESLPSRFCPKHSHCHTQGVLPFDNLGRREASIVALDALDFKSLWAENQFSVELVHRELFKAAVGFKGDPYEPEAHDSPQPVASGWWGCTVFGGDSRLKTLLQWIAASLAGRKLKFYTFGSNRIPHLQKQVYAMARKYKTVKNLYAALIAAVKQEGTAEGLTQQQKYAGSWGQGFHRSKGEAIWRALLKE